MDRLTRFRREVDDFMKHHPQSPLNPQQQRKFKGLNYYPPDSKLTFDVEVQRFPDSEPLIQMETSTGDTRTYRRYGRFSVVVDGEKAEFTLYTDPHGGDFFLPFKDGTNGQETYGAGRYLDNHRPGLLPLPDGRFEIDFNYAYNPYCAYSEYYSCPLPPRENWSRVPIRAGEKVFK